MVRPYKSIEELVNGAIEKGAAKFGGDKSLKRDGSKIICTKCAKNITFSRANITSRVTEHLKSVEHQSNKDKQPVHLITAQIARVNQKKKSDDVFKRDLLDTLLSCDIPLHKLKLPKMQEFMKKYIPDQKIPHPNTLRNGVNQMAADKIEEIRKTIGDSDIYMQIDETSDMSSRNVVNVIVGKLNDGQSKPMLLHVDFQNKTNNETIQMTVLDSCKLLRPKDNRYPNLVLLLSDQASYMVKAVEELKKMKIVFPRLLHVTCIVHAISLVCQSIKKEFHLVNKLFAYENRWFKNANKRRRNFRMVTKLPFIPLPIMIRWGSWINCANYHRSNLDQIKSYFNRIIEPKDSEVLKRMKQILSGQKIEKDIIRLTSHYGKISDIIKQLEGENLTMENQLILLNDVKQMVKGESHYHILMNSLKKNPDFKSFISDDANFSDRVKRTYAPLTSCAVERSFSVFRSIYRSNRTNFTQDNLRDHMLIKYNNFLS